MNLISSKPRVWIAKYQLEATNCATDTLLPSAVFSCSQTETVMRSDGGKDGLTKVGGGGRFIYLSCNWFSVEYGHLPPSP